MKEKSYRLVRYLSLCGVCSRREAFELVKQGKVSVDGNVVDNPGYRIFPGTSSVAVEGRELLAPKFYYFLLNKPRGVVCTNFRREKKRRAIDLVPKPEGVRLYTAGRLDMDSEGIIIITNDGELANLVTHPRYGIKKTYLVETRGRISGEALEKLKKGIWLAEGKLAPPKITVKKRSREKSILLVTVSEGRNREIRRMFARVKFPVRRLKRVRIGNITIHKLKPGAYRVLRKREIEELYGFSEKEKGGK